MIEVIGIIGGALFAAGCVPMAFKTWRQGRDLGTPLETQWLLFLACIMYSWFLFAAFGTGHLAFWFLVIEVVSWGVALWYHYYPRRVLQLREEDIFVSDDAKAEMARLNSVYEDIPFIETGAPLVYNRNPEGRKDDHGC